MIVMTSVPAKIVLKSTTKVTLSDRFTQIQKMRPPPPSPQEVRAQMAASQHSTQQNRRLAQQMANRPAVQAALGQRGGPKHPQQQVEFQQKTLKQRLGPSNVKARLTLGQQAYRGRGRGGRRGGYRGRGQSNGYVTSDSRGGMRGQGFGGRGRGGFSPRWIDDYRPRGRAVEAEVVGEPEEAVIVEDLGVASVEVGVEWDGAEEEGGVVPGEGDKPLGNNWITN
ncbi:CHTOP-like protein [Mya arenaria]|uniref:CHTOP-like protein n=1 Tax=Mya arenaria TaxID=6604 RepID=A0ABY7DX47_MYAAR|nr:CHTOP-like protein [Mya arenaria]